MNKELGTVTISIHDYINLKQGQGILETLQQGNNVFLYHDKLNNDFGVYFLTDKDIFIKLNEQSERIHNLIEKIKKLTPVPRKPWWKF